MVRALIGDVALGKPRLQGTRVEWRIQGLWPSRERRGVPEVRKLYGRESAHYWPVSYLHLELGLWDSALPGRHELQTVHGAAHHPGNKEELTGNPYFNPYLSATQ